MDISKWANVTCPDGLICGIFILVNMTIGVADCPPAEIGRAHV